MKLNILKLAHLARPRTHEGAPAAILTPEQTLRRSVLACMLWETEFYESGMTIAGRIRDLVPAVAPEKVAALAVEARTAMKLRHAPLLLVREMARHATHRGLVAETLVRVIQRADELAEFVAIYWAEGRRPLSAQVKKGLAAAFTHFDEYSLAKYDRAGAVRLRDVLFLTHAKPMTSDQALVWRRLIAGELATPDTWEVALSSGGNKRAHWERLLIGSPARIPRSPAQPSQHEGRRSRGGPGHRRDRRHADRPRSPVPLPRRSASCAAVGRGSRTRDVPLARRARSQRWSGSARRTHGHPRRRLRLHGRAVVAPFADASHRRGLRTRRAHARNRREGDDLHLLERGTAHPAPARIRSARRDGSEPAASGNLPRRCDSTPSTSSTTASSSSLMSSRTTASLPRAARVT